MEIVFQSHHAQVSEGMQERARRALQKLGVRLVRVVDAVVRFEQDGPTRRVEIVLRAPRRKALVAEGTGRFFGAALGTAIDRLEAQARQQKRVPKGRPKKLPRA